MADNKSDSTSTNTNTDDKGKVTDTNKKTDDATVKTFDPSALSDEQFAKVFEDNRLWEHKRFKQLNDRAKQAEKLEAEKAKAEEQRLVDEKKWQELAEKRQSELETLKTQLSQQKIDQAIFTEATKLGVVDHEVVAKLVSKDSIKLDEAGNVIGVAEAVKSLIEAKPYLKGDKTTTTTVGNGSNPPGDGSQAPKKFKASQLNDPKFFKENEADIMKALSLGMIEDDTPASQ